MQGKNTLHPAEAKLIESWSVFAGLFGISKTTMSILMLLFLRAEALTISEIGKLLKLSRGALTPALREAQLVGALRSYIPTGQKRLCYELLLSAHEPMDWYAWRVKRRLTILVEPAVAALEEVLRDEQSLYPDVVPRLHEVLDMYRKQRTILRNFIALSPAARRKMLDKLSTFTHI